MEIKDRRVKRTRRLLGEALVDLILEKGFNEVTIQDVTERADIGYRTFFRHYPDTLALLLDTIEAHFEEWRELLPYPGEAGVGSFDPESTPQKNGRQLFEYLSSKPNLMLAVFGPKGSRSAKEQVLAMGNKKAMLMMESFNQSGIEVEIIARHVTTATLSLVEWWLVNDMPHSPERMGEIYAQLVMKPLWGGILAKE